MKKLLSGCLAFLFVFSLASVALAEDLNPVGVYPLAKEKTTLTILMRQDVLVEDYDTNAFTRWVEETCNVDLQFELLPAGADGTDKLALMLSSGQKLPDIVNVPMTTLQDYVYGSAGIFRDLTPYYRDCAYYINQRMAEWPDIDLLGPVTVADGNIYSIPKYYNETIGLANKRLWINNEFLRALNLDVPTTTQEFYEMLRAFKEKDPNGNGIADEIPLLPTDINNLMGYLMNAFTYCNPSNNYYTMQNGTLGVCYTQEAFREGLRYMQRLCQEGLLSPLTFSQTPDQYKQTISGDGVTPTVGCFIAFSTSLSLNNYSTNPFTPLYTAIAPLTGPENVRFTEYTPSVPAPQWHITAYCEHPELAFRVGDLMMSEEAFLRCRIGEPETHWQYAEAGLPCYFPGVDAKFTFVSIWNETQNAMWRADIPGFSQDDLDRRYFDGDPINATYTCAAACEDYLACIPAQGEYVPTLIFTPEEVEEINEIQTSLNGYVKEYLARFVTGDLDIDKDWQTFQQELQNMGLDQFLRISQDAYDRMSR